MQSGLGRMEFDFWDVQRGDTSPAAGGSFEPLASLSVGNNVLRNVHVACVRGFTDVYWLLFDTGWQGMVVGLLSQDGPFTTTSAAFDSRGTRSSRFLLNTGAQPPHHLVILLLPLLLQKNRPLPVHRLRETFPTSPLLRNSAFDNVETGRMAPTSTIVAGNRQTAVFVCKAANAVDALAG